MQNATSETEIKSLYLSICVHHYTLRAPCPKGQGNDFLDAPEASLRAVSYGLERHGENAHVQTYTSAQQVRARAPILPSRCFRFSCTLHSDTMFEGCVSSRGRGLEVLGKYIFDTVVCRSARLCHTYFQPSDY